MLIQLDSTQSNNNYKFISTYFAILFYIPTAPAAPPSTTIESRYDWYILKIRLLCIYSDNIASRIGCNCTIFEPHKNEKRFFSDKIKPTYL